MVSQVNIALVSVAVLLTSGVEVRAGVISYVSDTRRIVAYAFVTDGSQEDEERVTDFPSAPFAPFDSSVNASASLSGVTLEASASQSSEFLPLAVIASGTSHIGWPGSENHHQGTYAYNNLTVGFELDEATPFQFSAEVSVTEAGVLEFAFVWVTLSGPGGEIFGIFGAGPSSESLDETGVLPPGYYGLDAGADLQNGPCLAPYTFDGNASYSFEFRIPEPASMALLLLGCPVVLRHRRR